MLETEMDSHLGYDRYERSSEPKYRNGTKPKTVRSKSSMGSSRSMFLRINRTPLNLRCFQKSKNRKIVLYLRYILSFSLMLYFSVRDDGVTGIKDAIYTAADEEAARK